MRVWFLSCEVVVKIQGNVLSNHYYWSVQGDFRIPRTGSWWSGWMNHQARGLLVNWIGDAFCLPRNDGAGRKLTASLLQMNQMLFWRWEKTFSWHWKCREGEDKNQETGILTHSWPGTGDRHASQVSLALQRVSSPGRVLQMCRMKGRVWRENGLFGLNHTH